MSVEVIIFSAEHTGQINDVVKKAEMSVFCPGFFQSFIHGNGRQYRVRNLVIFGLYKPNRPPVVRGLPQGDSVLKINKVFATR